MLAPFCQNSLHTKWHRTSQTYLRHLPCRMTSKSPIFALCHGSARRDGDNCHLSPTVSPQVSEEVAQVELQCRRRRAGGTTGPSQPTCRRHRPLLLTAPPPHATTTPAPRHPWQPHCHSQLAASLPTIKPLVRGIEEFVRSNDACLLALAAAMPHQTGRTATAVRARMRTTYPPRASARPSACP